MNSIMQSEKKCYITGRTTGLHHHHIYGGANRQVSEKNGFWVYLAAELHNMSDSGVHFNRALDLALKAECQRKFEETHTREEFMRLIGKNYLTDEPPKKKLDF